MMNRTMTLAAAAVALTAAAPAAAATYDAFSSFNATQGAGNFFYGQANPAAPGTSGTFYAITGSCAIAGTICLQETPGTVPGVYKTTNGAFQTGTVLVPDDRLIIHPGFDDGVAFAFFRAPTAGTYNFSATFSIQDTSPTGVDLFSIDTTSGGLPLVFNNIGTLGAGSGPQTFSFTRTLGASDGFAVGVGRRGNTFNDSTGLQFSAAAVPEPATWAMMLIGFGMVGFGLRRRKAKVTTNVSFA